MIEIKKDAKIMQRGVRTGMGISDGAGSSAKVILILVFFFF